LITDFSFTTVTVQGGGTLEIDSIGNSMKLIGTELIIESGGVLIADFVDIEVNKLIVDQSGKIHANGKVISFSNFFFHSFFFLNLTHARLEYNSDTCLNQTSLRPAFVFRIDRCYVYAG
jgi:hypothetical protein